MFAACFAGSCAALALAAGIEIGDIEGLTVPLAFACWGSQPRILLPAGWTGPIRDAAICAGYSALVGAVLTPQERVANWRRNVAAMVGPDEWALVDVDVA